MLNYDIFYRRNAVRLPAHLMLPYLPTIDKFQFPLDSIHHYMSWDSVLDGPESGEYFYRDIQKKIYVEHIQQLTSDRGAPKKTALMLMQLIRQYHMRNKRFRYADKPTETISDPYTLVTINYCPVAKGYRYVRSIYADYYKWWNLQKTMWSKAVEVAQYSGRQQFMFFDLPEKLPSMNTLNIHANKFTDKTVRNLGGPNSWFLLEIWKWLSQEHRYESVIGDVSQESLKKLNIIFKESGRYVVINLGTINSWRYIKGQELEGQKTKIAPIDLQKRFLKLLMTMMALRSSVVVDDEINTDEESGVKISVNPTEVSASDTDDGEKSASEIAQSLLDSLDEDLATLEELSSDEDVSGDLPKEHSQSSVSLDDFKIGETPEEVLKKVCDDLADNGALTAAEYRRFLNLSENYKKIKSPFSNESLSEFASVSNKDLVIDSYKFEDIATVPDKTMLKNSLVEFDEQYIKHVLNKDIASMVVNSQKGGFVINKYDVERVENISGKFDIHTVRITPIEGLPSTLRFNIPVLDEEGVYVSGGVRYRQRKQRGDAPFRKTDPDRVAMTTYFGKTFVSRSDKKVNDYGAWLREQVMKKGMDTSDKDISNLSPANIFDNEYDTSRSYTSLAMGFKSFDAKGYHFILDRNSDSFSEEAKKYNKDGNAVIAVNDSGEHLIVDKSGVIYSIGKDGLDPKGSLESFLGINVISAPVDFAQVKVYGKNLPVGIVLGYMYGLDNLFEKFKITPRRVAAGQRLNLQENEFSIAFADETLIFSRDDQFASMIFGGFKEFEKSLKNFSVHTFDKKNVYLNVLESQGIGVRYLREIEMFNDMFVDPISKGLLEDKGLPSTFPGLLIEASKALLTDAHPDTLDMEYMRIKGYERFAGAVYAEVCQAVREHRTKSGKKHQQIELNPHAVWKRIARDPSVTTSSGINPIKNLKEKEAVTYNGVGGRTSRSMVRTTRAYHKNDMGVISESTVDSSDVGINTFLTADPQFNSLRGTTKRVNLKNAGVTPMLSTSAQLSVGSMHDD